MNMCVGEREKKSMNACEKHVYIHLHVTVVHVCTLYMYLAHSLSSGFSSPGKAGPGTRFMLVNQVALGNCKVSEYIHVHVYVQYIYTCIHVRTCIYTCTCLYM